MTGKKDRDLEALLTFQTQSVLFGEHLIEKAKKLEMYCALAADELRDDASQNSFNLIVDFSAKLQNSGRKVVQIMDCERRKTQKEISDFNGLIGKA